MLAAIRVEAANQRIDKGILAVSESRDLLHRRCAEDAGLDLTWKYIMHLEVTASMKMHGSLGDLTNRVWYQIRDVPLIV